ncbi:MAG: DUF2851 family protein [Dehalococcoidales bacterium]|nr:DUF2851 family protein [Dehalococcoidales bacterium]
MPDNLPESHLVKVWQRQWLDSTGLVTERGEPIRVIYPGRLNDEPGADFRDAVIATRKGLRKGDVEIHVRSSGWREHQHHRHPVYNRVILHVVMWNNNKAATRLQNGREVPTLALNRYLKIPFSHRLNPASPAFQCMPCLKVAPVPSNETVAGFLDRAGEERFLAKAAGFKKDLVQTEVGQSLYQGIMGALGYSKNKLPMLELARRLPLQVLESVTQGRMSDEERLLRCQAWLLGMAGLPFPPFRDGYRAIPNDRWLVRLSGQWAFPRHPRVMSARVWNLFKVRPNNSPPQRLVAMSYLLLRYREKGLLEGLVNLVREAPVSRGYHELEKGLMVAADGSKTGALLGRGRAADIIVNVLLPFTFAWSRFASRSGLGDKAIDLYYHYPRLAANSVEKHMVEQFGLDRNLVSSARRQQGLIHIYNSLCTQGRCNECLLTQLQARQDIQV